jgi:hypothetical protein
MNEQSPMSRRQAISGLGTGLAAVAIPQIFATSEAAPPAFPAKLQDPTDKSATVAEQILVLLVLTNRYFDQVPHILLAIAKR